MQEMFRINKDDTDKAACKYKRAREDLIRIKGEEAVKWPVLKPQDMRLIDISEDAETVQAARERQKMNKVHKTGGGDGPRNGYLEPSWIWAVKGNADSASPTLHSCEYCITIYFY
jgi:hypothetical protein